MEAFRCYLNADETQEGLAISEIPLQMINPDGKSVFGVQIGVLWDNVRSPAPCYHSPEQISHIMEEDYEENAEENAEKVDSTVETAL